MPYIALFLLQILILFFLSKKFTKKITIFFYRITKSKRWTYYLYAILFLPGTFIHEIAHFLMALILFVPVGSIEFLPKIEEEGNVKLGSVAISKIDPFRRFLVGIAPLILGTSIIVGLIYLFSLNKDFSNPYYLILVVYLVFEIGNTMFLSKKDLEGTWILVLFFVFLAGFLYLIGIRLDVSNISPALIEIIIKANEFLVIPITIDALLLLVFRVSK